MAKLSLLIIAVFLLGILNAPSGGDATPPPPPASIRVCELLNALPPGSNSPSLNALIQILEHLSHR